MKKTRYLITFYLLFNSVISLATALPKSLEEYVERSDIVAEFEVIDFRYEDKAVFVEQKIESETILTEQEFTFTIYKLRVVEPYIGCNSGDIIEIHRFGGISSKGGLTSRWTHEIDLKSGEKVLMLIRYDEVNDIYASTSASITTYNLVQDDAGDAMLESHSGAPVYLTEEDVARSVGDRGANSTASSVSLSDFIGVLDDD